MPGKPSSSWRGQLTLTAGQKPGNWGGNERLRTNNMYKLVFTFVCTIALGHISPVSRHPKLEPKRYRFSSSSWQNRTDKLLLRGPYPFPLRKINSRRFTTPLANQIVLDEKATGGCTELKWAKTPLNAIVFSSLPMRTSSCFLSGGTGRRSTNFLAWCIGRQQLQTKPGKVKHDHTGHSLSIHLTPLVTGSRAPSCYPERIRAAYGP